MRKEYERIWLRSRNEPFNLSDPAFYARKVNDSLIEYVRADILASQVVAEIEKVWQKAIEAIKPTVENWRMLSLCAHPTAREMYGQVFRAGSDIVKLLETTRTADIRASKIEREGITEEDIAETRYPEHMPENR